MPLANRKLKRNSTAITTSHNAGSPGISRLMSRRMTNSRQLQDDAVWVGRRAGPGLSAEPNHLNEFQA
jgi:hypothetical protein